jgi:hypothetical protein
MPQTPHQWNEEVKEHVNGLQDLKRWLRSIINDKDTDWDSQKSAHQALKFLELAEYEMWNMEYFGSEGERGRYHEGEGTVA